MWSCVWQLQSSVKTRSPFSCWRGELKQGGKNERMTHFVMWCFFGCFWCTTESLNCCFKCTSCLAQGVVLTVLPEGFPSFESPRGPIPCSSVVPLKNFCSCATYHAILSRNYGSWWKNGDLWCAGFRKVEKASSATCTWSNLYLY